MEPLRTPWPRLSVENFAVDLVDRELALSLIMESLTEDSPLAVVSANLEHVHHFARCEPEMFSPPAVSEPEGRRDGIRWLTLLDGVPLVRTANSLTKRKWPKLSGSEILGSILAEAAVVGARVGVLGGTDETHRLLRQVLKRTYPHLKLAGTWSPSRFELMDNRKSTLLANRISDAGVDILVVALGKPLQEEWTRDFGKSTHAKAFLCFGAAVDFLAGRIQRAPEWVVRSGCEWAWRLALEPRRLARRYLVQGPPALFELKRRAEVIAAAE